MMSIPLVKSAFFKEEETRKQIADFVLTTPRFSMGDMCATFEEEFSKVQKRKHSVYVTSGSMANLILLQSLLNMGILQKGDLIGFSDLTWATNVMPIIQLGLIPVALDCEVDTLNLSTDILQRTDAKLRAVFLTNVLGFCGDIADIRAYCDAHDILLLEDNCESLGSAYQETLLGNFGLASTFSFFLGHHLSTMEGGMICTDDDALYEMLVMTRAHGWDRNLPPATQERLRTEHHLDAFYAKYTFFDLAYNGRPTEIQTAAVFRRDDREAHCQF
jgi:CDP-6-deoxy-D-xylo-4-hexulose-3-dehydrase